MILIKKVLVLLILCHLHRSSQSRVISTDELEEFIIRSVVSDQIV